MAANSPTPDDFRKIGFTADAVNYPLSEAGRAIIAEHNGVRVDQLPNAACYSSGSHMHEWIEALGKAKLEGRPYRHNGKLLTIGELKLGKVLT